MQAPKGSFANATLDPNEESKLLKAISKIGRRWSGQLKEYMASRARRTFLKCEVEQGKNLADAARKAGVEHFVYSSVGGVERNSGISHWESKWEIENYIRKFGLPATMITSSIQ
jgi:hypothetical protein